MQAPLSSALPDIRMGCDPVTRNLDTRGDPNPLSPCDIIEKSFERRRAAGSPGQTTMQTDRHHAGTAVALAIEHIKGVLQIGKELVAGVEPLRGGEPHVVRVESVGYDQLRLAGAGVPIRQIVGIAVSVVNK